MRGNAPTRGFTFIGLVIMMVIGCTVYLKLWSVSSYISLRDAEIMRSQFERAQNEALDESAEWRVKYDEEVQRSDAGKALMLCNRDKVSVHKRKKDSELSYARVQCFLMLNLPIGSIEQDLAHNVLVREELEKKIEEAEKSKSDLAVLQKEKQSLHKRMESLLHELQSVKMKCHI